MQIIHLPKEAMPTGLVSCDFRRPTFRDRREASAKYPGQAANPGYTLEQLFFAYCLEKINDNPLPPNPNDYISRLEGFPLEDAQFAIEVFLEMFTLNQEMASAAKDYGLELKKQLASSYLIPSHKLPGGGPSVAFRAPLLQDSISANRAVPREETSYTAEELLLARCIEEIDGKMIDNKGGIEILDNFWHEDVQFLLGVFYSMFTLDRPKRETARSWAKRLRGESSDSTFAKIPPAGSTKTSATSK